MDEAEYPLKNYGQYQYQTIVLNNKTGPLFLEFN